MPHPGAGQPERVRVLVVASPLVGHVLPVVPLATALQDAGHEVVVGTGGEGTRACPAGLTAVDAAPGFRMGPRVARRLLLRPRLMRAELAGRGGTRAVGLLFAVVAERMAEGVLAVADRLTPDLVVHEPLAAAGALRPPAGVLPRCWSTPASTTPPSCTTR